MFYPQISMLSFWMYKNECFNIYAILRLCVLYHVLFLAVIAPWINLIDYSTATAILPLRKACILIDVDIPNCQTCCVLWCLLHISFIRQWASCLKLGFEILSSSTHLHSWSFPATYYLGGGMKVMVVVVRGHYSVVHACGCNMPLWFVFHHLFYFYTSACYTEWDSY